MNTTMKTKLVRPREWKAVAIGIGLVTTWVAVSLYLTHSIAVGNNMLFDQSLLQVPARIKAVLRSIGLILGVRLILLKTL